jgi:4-aminobutyrate aminotransferase / (S)-3-amino-2-methylpropionate transaminase / 5-aminovalerate transaminase
MSLPRVTHGKNDLLFTDDGESFVDLISSTGAVFLGHANDAINQHVVAQLDRISCSWTSVMDIQDDCKEQVARHLPDDFSLYSLYSSGMEAAEVAMRMAFHETKRSGIIGFRNNNHGKSVATQNITGADPDIPAFDTFRQVPFLPDHSELEIVRHLEKEIASTDAAAVYIEPMQGRGGGYEASKDFYGEVQQLCRDHGVLVICDEIFTGFYRTGPCFHFPMLGIEPDIVLIGKAISNGFPASGVVLHERFKYHPKDFRFGSTYSDSPLACAAVVGTLAEMERIGIEERVAHIERSFAGLDGGPNAQLRLRGAVCFLELDSQRTAASVHDHLYKHNILTLRRGTVLGFWPPATITDEHLGQVVSVANEGLARLG